MAVVAICAKFCGGGRRREPLEQNKGREIGVDGGICVVMACQGLQKAILFFLKGLEKAESGLERPCQGLQKAILTGLEKAMSGLQKLFF